MRSLFRTEWPFWTLIAGMFLVSVAAWSRVPERIPAHWNAYGHVDRYGGKWEGLLLLPAIGAGVYLLMLLLPRIDPGRANYERFQTAYWVIRFVILAHLAVAYATVLLTAFGYTVDVGRIMLLSLGVVLLTLGGIMGKVRPNWFVGVRTPWTLSSKLSWTHTHRAAGWIFMLLGLATFPAAFLPAPWNLAAVLGSLLLGTVWLLLYSYVLWRRDPDRVPPSGTTPADE